MGNLANFIQRKQKVIIGIVILLNIIALLSFYNFRFSTDYLSFFKGNHEMSNTYDQISQKYQGIEMVQVLIETNKNNESLLEKENLKEISSYQHKLDQIKGVSFLRGFLPKALPTPQGTIEVNEEWINAHYEPLASSLKTSEYTKELLSEDYTLGLIMVGLTDQADSSEVINQIKEITIGRGLKLDYAGNQVIVNTIFDYLLKIILVLPPLAILLVLLTFYLNIRVKKLTILSMLPAAFGALWTFGTVFLLGKELSIITVIAPIFIIVLGSADGLHFTIHYLDRLKEHHDKQLAIKETLELVGAPIIMTSLTTMAGFLSLSFSDIVAMQDLGITTALGIGYAGLISLFFLPVILHKIDINPPLSLENKEHRIIKILQSLVKHRLAILAFFLMIVIAFGSFIPTLIVDSNQLAFFKKGSEIRKTFEKIESNFGSSLPIIGEFKKKEEGLNDLTYANEILQLERNLEEKTGVKKVVSAYDLIQQPIDIDLNQWVSDDGLKFVITTENMSGEEQDQLIAELKSNNNVLSLTGMPILFREMNKLIVTNQISSLFIALALVSIMLGISFRNIRNTLIGLLPIIVTIISLFGFLAVTNMNLNMMTANMASIAIGVGIDYSIHFIAVINYYQKKGESNVIEKTLETAGRPILTNAFGLAIGLSVYLLSPFRIHSQVSMVMWLAMILSSFTALLVIPQFYKKVKIKIEHNESL